MKYIEWCNFQTITVMYIKVYISGMEIVILIYQIIQEKFAYGELFMLVMIGYIFMFRMVKKMKNSGLEIVAGLTPPLRLRPKK